MTPLLRPVWCAANAGSASSTTSDRLFRSSSALAVAVPTMPPPIIAMSKVSAMVDDGRSAVPSPVSSGLRSQNRLFLHRHVHALAHLRVPVERPQGEEP